MALSRGRPRKFVDGFVSANKRIYITDETFLRWRKLRTEYNLSTDDMLTRRLLDSVIPQEGSVSRRQQQTNPSFPQGQSLSSLKKLIQKTHLL